jgi:hypothetical protein
MKARTAPRLAWSAWSLAALLPFAMLVLTLAHGQPLSIDAGVGIGFIGLQLAFSTVGALVASRRPGNPIGWLFCFEGLALSLTGASEEYAVLAVTGPSSLPLGDVVAWLATLLDITIIVPLIFLFLLFPDGRLPSRRWSLVAWLAVVGLAITLLSTAFAPGPLNSSVQVTNPFGVQALRRILPPLFVPAFLVVLGALLASVASMVLRLRRARGQQRQQLKWFASGAAILGVAFVVGPITWMIPAIPEAVWQAIFLLAVGTLPLSAGIAILRYRLFDIDLIINRALVYGALTAILGSAYVLSVTIAGTILQGSDLVTAAATLAVAALFRPLRRRVQGFIDRRFYRRRYDAIQTVESFAGRLREEVDLDSLTRDLLSTVNRTLQPAHSSLWLRG